MILELINLLWLLCADWISSEFVLLFLLGHTLIFNTLFSIFFIFEYFIFYNFIFNYFIFYYTIF